VDCDKFVRDMSGTAENLDSWNFPDVRVLSSAFKMAHSRATDYTNVFTYTHKVQMKDPVGSFLKKGLSCAT